MRVLKFFGVLLIFAILTVFTQVGGILYLLSIITYPLINKKITSRFTRFSTKLISFIVIYLVGSLIFVPLIAKPLGRVPLPIFETHNVKPRTIWTALMNRNYVRPEFREAIFNVAANMNKEYPGTVLNYLDACQPFINGYPMLGHLSHTDGRKLDVALCYLNKAGEQSNLTPSPTGYGIYEGPEKNEVDQQFLCRQKGFWQGNALGGKLNDHSEFLFDEARTRSLTNYFAQEVLIEKIFIEPHLETRLGLTNPKIRFQGCHASRHDDHIHVQVH